MRGFIGNIWGGPVLPGNNRLSAAYSGSWTFWQPVMFSALEQNFSPMSSSVKLQQEFKIYTSFSWQNLFYKITSLSYLNLVKWHT